MLAAKAQLPALLEVVRPKGGDGAVDGLGVPLQSGAAKEDLAKPMERGVYAISTADQKTVLKLRVFSREEAGFDPDAVLASPIGSVLEDEARDRIRSTWTILQLTVEAYDPALYPALDLLAQVAGRLGVLTEGVIADPLAGQYRMPEHFPSHKMPGEPFEVRDYVSVVSLLGVGNWQLTTAGLVKFAQREIGIAEVPDEWTGPASALLLSVAAGVMKGKTLEPGDRLVSENGWIIAESVNSAPQLGGAELLELLPLRGTVGDALGEWMKANG